VRLIRENLVRPEPSIHAGAEMWMLAPARSGQWLVRYDGVSRVFEKRGNQFTQDDIEIRDASDMAVGRVNTTTIYAFKAPRDVGGTA
jgi:hypothetical protein